MQKQQEPEMYKYEFPIGEGRMRMAQINQAGIPMLDYEFAREIMKFVVVINAQHANAMDTLLDEMRDQNKWARKQSGKRRGVGIPHTFIAFFIMIAVIAIVGGAMYGMTAFPITSGVGSAIEDVGSGIGDAISSVEGITMGIGNLISGQWLPWNRTNAVDKEEGLIREPEEEKVSWWKVWKR